MEKEKNNNTVVKEIDTTQSNNTNVIDELSDSAILTIIDRFSDKSPDKTSGFLEQAIINTPMLMDELRKRLGNIFNKYGKLSDSDVKSLIEGSASQSDKIKQIINDIKNEDFGFTLDKNIKQEDIINYIESTGNITNKALLTLNLLRSTDSYNLYNSLLDSFLKEKDVEKLIKKTSNLFDYVTSSSGFDPNYFFYVIGSNADKKIGSPGYKNFIEKEPSYSEAFLDKGDIAQIPEVDPVAANLKKLNNISNKNILGNIGGFLSNIGSDIGDIGAGIGTVMSAIPGAMYNILTGNQPIDIVKQAPTWGEAASRMARSILTEWTHPVTYFKTKPVSATLDLLSTIDLTKKGLGKLAKLKKVTKATESAAEASKLSDVGKAAETGEAIKEAGKVAPKVEDISQAGKVQETGEVAQKIEEAVPKVEDIQPEKIAPEPSIGEKSRLAELEKNKNIISNLLSDEKIASTMANEINNALDDVMKETVNINKKTNTIKVSAEISNTAYKIDKATDNLTKIFKLGEDINELPIDVGNIKLYADEILRPQFKNIILKNIKSSIPLLGVDDLAKIVNIFDEATLTKPFAEEIKRIINLPKNLITKSEIELAKSILRENLKNIKPINEIKNIIAESVSTKFKDIAWIKSMIENIVVPGKNISEKLGQAVIEVANKMGIKKGSVIQIVPVFDKINNKLYFSLITSEKNNKLFKFFDKINKKKLKVGDYIIKYNDKLMLNKAINYIKNILINGKQIANKLMMRIPDSFSFKVKDSKLLSATTFIEGSKNIVNALVNIFKQNVLFTRPAWVVNNIIGNLIFGLIDDPKSLLNIIKDPSLSGKVGKYINTETIARDLPKISKFGKATDIIGHLVAATTTGMTVAAAGSYILGPVGGAIGFGVGVFLPTFIIKTNEYVEQLFRGARFLSAMKAINPEEYANIVNHIKKLKTNLNILDDLAAQGAKANMDDILKAVNAVNDTYFDYKNTLGLTEGGRTLISIIFPFWKFYVHSFNMLVKLIKKHPLKLAIINKLSKLNEQQKYYGERYSTEKYESDFFLKEIANNIESIIMRNNPFYRYQIELMRSGVELSDKLLDTYEYQAGGGKLLASSKAKSIISMKAANPFDLYFSIIGSLANTKDPSELFRKISDSPANIFTSPIVKLSYMLAFGKDPLTNKDIMLKQKYMEGKDYVVLATVPGGDDVMLLEKSLYDSLVKNILSGQEIPNKVIKNIRYVSAKRKFIPIDRVIMENILPQTARVLYVFTGKNVSKSLNVYDAIKEFCSEVFTNASTLDKIKNEFYKYLLENENMSYDDYKNIKDITEKQKKVGKFLTTVSKNKDLHRYIVDFLLKYKISSDKLGIVLNENIENRVDKEKVLTLFRIIGLPIYDIYYRENDPTVLQHILRNFSNINPSLRQNVISLLSFFME